MTRTRGVYMMAGVMNLIGLALGWYVSPWFFLLSVFVGLNLLQASLTGFCPAEKILARLGLPAGTCGLTNDPPK